MIRSNEIRPRIPRKLYFFKHSVFGNHEAAAPDSSLLSFSSIAPHVALRRICSLHRKLLGKKTRQFVLAFFKSRKQFARIDVAHGSFERTKSKIAHRFLTCWKMAGYLGSLERGKMTVTRKVVKIMLVGELAGPFNICSQSCGVFYLSDSLHSTVELMFPT